MGGVQVSYRGGNRVGRAQPAGQLGGAWHAALSRARLLPACRVHHGVHGHRRVSTEAQVITLRAPDSTPTAQLWRAANSLAQPTAVAPRSARVQLSQGPGEGGVLHLSLPPGSLSLLLLEDVLF